MGRMPFLFKKCSNSELTKHIPLSDTTMSGTPNLAKILLKHCMTTADVADLTPNASIHFKWSSMIMRSMWPSTGPTKSMWSLDQGLLSHSHGWSGALRDEVQLCWKAEQYRTVSSICSSIFGHQTYILARLFILATPGCPQWSSSKICCLPGGGRITRFPHRRQPSLPKTWYFGKQMAEVSSHDPALANHPAPIATLVPAQGLVWSGPLPNLECW